jgi:hypothetical protein
MNLYEKIRNIYPSLTDDDFWGKLPTILLQNDGKGDYIKSWNHPSLPQPTQEQLDGVK